IANPTAMWDEAAIVRSLRVASAGMDLSDGLFEAITVMCGNTFGFKLHLDAIPYHGFAHQCSRNLGVPLINFALGTGDWNIAFSVEKSHMNKLTKVALEKGVDL